MIDRLYEDYEEGCAWCGRLLTRAAWRVHSCPVRGRWYQAPPPLGIEVTPAMMEAGLRAYREHRATELATLLAVVYRAMAAAGAVLIRGTLS